MIEATKKKRTKPKHNFARIGATQAASKPGAYLKNLTKLYAGILEVTDAGPVRERLIARLDPFLLGPGYDGDQMEDALFFLAARGEIERIKDSPF